MGLRYTGSSPAGLILAGDKILTKKVLTFHGITTPRFATIYRGALDWAQELHFPVIVKPPQEDASVGLTSASVVHDLKQLLEQMDALQTEFASPVLVEEDRKSTRLNSSHSQISYAVFCLKKKKTARR